jgi:hypothetical protein
MPVLEKLSHRNHVRACSGVVKKRTILKVHSAIERLFIQWDVEHRCK